MSIRMSVKLEEENEFKNHKRQNSGITKDKSSGIQPEFQKQLSDIVKRIEKLLKEKYLQNL